MNDSSPILCEQTAPSPEGVAAPLTAFLLLRAAHAVEDRLEAALAPVGLSLAKHKLLTQLVEAGEPVPLGCLADRCSCVRSNMTQLVDRLEGERLVERVNDPKDRRSVLASITAEGRERQREGAERLGATDREMFKDLGAVERETLARLSRRLRGES
jgi:DNA-binding MarR family transcriptional regulator